MTTAEPKVMLLRVEAPHFVAGAVWVKIPGQSWRCTEAAPIIKWMVGKSPASCRTYLEKKRWSWKWMPTTD
jgi:hypothetical protein